MHDALGHPGKHRTLARVLGRYYWRGAYSDTVRYVRSCHKCQLSKQDRRNREGDARALPVPAEPWEAVHMDWITGLPKAADSSDAVLVFIDTLTGMVHFQACQKTDTSKNTARHLVHHVVRLQGVPKAIHSDRDIRLTAHFTGAFGYGIALHYTSSSAGEWKPRRGAREQYIPGDKMLLRAL